MNNRDENLHASSTLFQEISLVEARIANTWKIKQNDLLDKKTSFIYRCESLFELEKRCQVLNLSHQEIVYANHRWRNFKRHDAWLYLLAGSVKGLSLNPSKMDSKSDFFLELGLTKKPFDLKLTRYPNTAPSDLTDHELARWLYENQSKQQRFHLHNRFFVIGNPEDSLYNFDAAKETVKKFNSGEDFSIHRIVFSDESSTNAILIRHSN